MLKTDMSYPFRWPNGIILEDIVFQQIAKCIEGYHVIVWVCKGW